MAILGLVCSKMARRKQLQSTVSGALLSSQNFKSFGANERCFKLAAARARFSRMHHQHEF